MKNKLICLLLVLALMFSTLVVLSSCNKDPADDNTQSGDQKKDDPGKTDDPTDDPGKTDDPTGDPTEKCNNPADVNKDGRCDNCGKSILGHDNETQKADWWEDITYEKTNLIFELNDCSNYEELPSGCERYLQGDPEFTAIIDSELADMISERNSDCYDLANVTVEYRYLGENASTYGWSKNIDRIFQAVQARTKDSPDMYCNYMTDMLCTSLKGSFANLYSRAHGDNFMDISADGYMSELMSSLTLSLEKIYVVASDYFIDLIRAFFIVPVNRSLFEANCIYSATNPNGIKDLNNDGVINIDDLFVEVENRDWTYNRIAQYSAMAWSNTSGEATASLKDQVGFAVAAGGLSAAGILYTTSVSIIHKDWNDATGDFDYGFPSKNQQLLDLTAAMKVLFESTGVISVSGSETYGYGSTHLLAIRERFSQDSVLFGGIILLGSLEYEAYQNMKGVDRGFGVLPVPMYHQYETNRDGSYKYYEIDAAGNYVVDDFGDYVEAANVASYTTKVDSEGLVLSDGANQIKVMKDNYLTQVHAVGRAGAIAYNTPKFTQCTAFLQYQSTHSTDILNNYYNYELMLNTSDTSIKGNIDILKFIRSNVRTSFDKLFEDAVGFFYESTDTNSVAKRWHSVLAAGTNEKYKPSSLGPYRRTDMESIYDELAPSKDANLQYLVVEYETLPE